MISTILNIVSGLFWAAGKIFEFLYARNLVDAGKTQAKLETLNKQVRDAQIAIAAREAIRNDIISNDGRLPDDDPFLRD